MSGALLLAVAAHLPSISCEVDESRPDLSAFKLRPSDQRNTRTSGAPIEDYTTGVMLMRSSLFISDTQARCSAYAHLLKLIRKVKDGQTSDGQKLRQDTVNALAIMVDAEQQLYGKLIRMYQKNQMGPLFQEAIKGLEKYEAQTPLCRDTWLELIDCALQFELNLENFLKEPLRARQIETYRQSKIDAMDNESASTPPMRALSSEEIEEARRKVYSFDDDELVEVLFTLTADAIGGETRPLLDTTEAPIQAQSSESERRDAPEVNNKLDTRPTVPFYESPNFSPTEYELSVKGITKRLEQLKGIEWRFDSLSRAPVNEVRSMKKLSVTDASDYLQAWNNLVFWVQHGITKSAVLAGGLEREVYDYITNTHHQLVQARMQGIMDNHILVNEAHEKITTKGHKYRLMDELDAAYSHLIGLLNKTDPLLEIHDSMRALMRSYERKRREYEVINRFIESRTW